MQCDNIEDNNDNNNNNNKSLYLNEWADKIHEGCQYPPCKNIKKLNKEH